MRKLTQQELEIIIYFQRDVYKEKINLSNANLSNANLEDADLSNADLENADLRYAYLKGANLRSADLRGANLRGANLRRANLRGADLRDADLRGADLRSADLRDADLRSADLRDADLSNADLSNADYYNTILNQQCPEEGAFIAFKKLNWGVICKLQITENAKRSSATSRKCRCSEVLVLEFLNSDLTEAPSKYDENFIYKVGEIVKVDNFDENRWNECAPGIHFFITKKEAEEY